MISVNKLYFIEEENLVKISADLLIDGKFRNIWFSTDKKNKDFISIGNGDSFVLILFIYAVLNNKELVVNIPTSKRLVYGLKEILLPAFKSKGYVRENVQLTFNNIHNLLYPDASSVGTAMSFGVDSFYTIFENIKTEQGVTHLTLFNAGAYGQNGGEVARELFENMKMRVDKLASEMELDFIWVDTNLNEVIEMPFVQTHTYRNFACVLMFQKLFKVYYYASGVTLDSFKININDPAYYDLLISKAVSGNGLEFFISGLNADRIFKTESISKLNITHEHLNVCLVTSDNKNLNKEGSHIKNCSKCFKCVRTMVSLDILGELDLYKNVFDLEIYSKNKDMYLAEILYMKFRAKNIFSIEIFEKIKKLNYKYSYKVYYFLTLRFLKALLKYKNA